MNLQDWVIKEMQMLIARMNENTSIASTAFKNQKERISKLEDRIQHLERSLMDGRK